MTGEGTPFRKGIYRGFSPTIANLVMRICRERGVQSRIDTCVSSDSLEFQVYISGENSWEIQNEIRFDVEKELGYTIWSHLN